MFDRITDPTVIEGYLTDASNVRGRAEVLVRPRSAAEVGEVLAHCQAEGIPVTVTSARTSTTAAAVPQGGWLLSMERLVAVGPIVEAGDGTARIEAEGGIRLGELQAGIEAAGWFFPPDPTSRHDCTLGGAIACNASGARSFKYGATRPWVDALQVVLPTGEILDIDRDTPIPDGWSVPRWHEPAVKTAAGYAPTERLLELMVGQEGTLGVVTRARLKLIRKPPEEMGILAFFPDRAATVAFVERAREAARRHPTGALSPRCLEYLDHHCLALAQERVGGVPDAARAALFCEQEQHGDPDDHLAAWFEALEATGALVDATLITTDPAGRQRLHALRHAIPAGINERVVRNGMPKVGTDLAVPDAALVAMLDAYDRAPMEHVLFGHIGDNHLHLNLLPTSRDQLDEAKRFYDGLVRLAVGLGGTVSAEHGIGKLKRAHLKEMVGPDLLARFVTLKRQVDPAWILGRGNLVDPPAGFVV